MPISSAPPSTDLVLAERRGSVLVLSLNRPEGLNAWTDALEERYARLRERLDEEETMRVNVTGIFLMCRATGGESLALMHRLPIARRPPARGEFLEVST